MNKPKAPAKPRNWVAKHAITMCKAARHKNKKKDYQRNPRTKKDWGSFLGDRLTMDACRSTAI